MKNINKTIGIFCHGGAWRGAYHAGFLKSAEDLNIEIDQFVGVSSGFFASFAHAAKVNHREFWEDKHSPLYLEFHKKDVFNRAINYFFPKMLKMSPLTENEILEYMNSKVSAIALPIRIPAKHFKMKEFSSIKEIIDAQKSTGSIPWFLKDFPGKYRGVKFLDGVLCISKAPTYLNTDIKIILQIIPPFKKSKYKDQYYFKNNYPKLIKTFLWGKPKDYLDMWDDGFFDGKRFFTRLIQSNKGSLEAFEWN